MCVCIYVCEGDYAFHLNTKDPEAVANNVILPSLSPTVSLFTVVRFANSECVVNGNSGTCYTASECRREGGTEIGSCARGFGVCCYSEFLLRVK